LWNYGNGYLVLFSLVALLVITYKWRRELRRERRYLGNHTIKIQDCLKLAIILFIFREVMLFFSFFWTFFHFSLNPTGDVGFKFPSTGLKSLNAFRIPFLNTIILVSSGLTITISHNLIIMRSKKRINWLVVTVLLGAIFTTFQIFEYYQSSFNFMIRSRRNIFFTATGFHGVHVLIGTCLLLISLIKMYFNNYNRLHHLFFEDAIWYWHFVDVVWLFLFVAIYWWGG